MLDSPALVASDTKDDRQRSSTCRTTRIALSDIQRGKQLGRGGGGQVFEGTWTINRTRATPPLPPPSSMDPLCAKPKSPSTSAPSLAAQHQQVLQVALKKLHPSSSAERKSYLALYDALCNAPPHRNVVTLYGICTDVEHNPIIVMERAQSSLDKHIRDAAFVPQLAHRVALQVAQGLQFLHTLRHPGCVLHLDLKPSNILTFDNLATVKLCDFDFSKPTNNDATMPTKPRLTTSYCAPEQLLGELVSRATDIFSFGIIMWELATQQPPRWGAAEAEDIACARARQNHAPLPWPAKLRKGFDPEWKELAERCMQRDQAARPTILEVVVRIKRLSSSKWGNDVLTPQQSPMLQAQHAVAWPDSMGEQRGLSRSDGATPNLTPNHSEAVSDVEVERWMDENPEVAAEQLLCAAPINAAQQLLPRSSNNNMERSAPSIPSVDAIRASSGTSSINDDAALPLIVEEAEEGIVDESPLMRSPNTSSDRAKMLLARLRLATNFPSLTTTVALLLIQSISVPQFWTMLFTIVKKTGSLWTGALATVALVILGLLPQALLVGLSCVTHRYSMSSIAHALLPNHRRKATAVGLCISIMVALLALALCLQTITLLRRYMGIIRRILSGQSSVPEEGWVWMLIFSLPCFLLSCVSVLSHWFLKGSSWFGIGCQVFFLLVMIYADSTSSFEEHVNPIHALPDYQSWASVVCALSSPLMLGAFNTPVFVGHVVAGRNMNHADRVKRCTQLFAVFSGTLIGFYLLAYGATFYMNQVSNHTNVMSYKNLLVSIGRFGVFCGICCRFPLNAIACRSALADVVRAVVLRRPRIEEEADVRRDAEEPKTVRGGPHKTGYELDDTAQAHRLFTQRASFVARVISGFLLVTFLCCISWFTFSLDNTETLRAMCRLFAPAWILGAVVTFAFPACAATLWARGGAREGEEPTAVRPSVSPLLRIAVMGVSAVLICVACCVIAATVQVSYDGDAVCDYFGMLNTTAK